MTLIRERERDTQKTTATMHIQARTLAQQEEEEEKRIIITQKQLYLRPVLIDEECLRIL